MFPQQLLRRLVAALLVLLLVLGGVGAAVPAAHAQDERLIWATVGGVPQEVSLRAVFMLDRELAWAAGYDTASGRGVVYRLRLLDGRWQVARDADFDRPIFALVALDRERVVVVGDGGLIARRDALGGWTTEGPSDRSMQLHALALFEDGRAGWALGARGDQALALRYADGRWFEATIEAPGGTSLVNAVHFAPGAGWAVGSHIWRLAGNEWRLERMPDLCGGGSGCTLSLDGVRALDSERAWLAGSLVSTCAICQAKGRLAVRGAGGWTNAFPERAPIDSLAPAVPGYDSNTLTGLYFVDANEGLAVGHRRFSTADGSFSADTIALRYSGGNWRYERLVARSNATPHAVFMLDATRALVVGSEGLLLSYGYGAQANLPGPGGNPTQPVPDPGLPGVRYFSETGHTLRGSFRSYWESNGGLMRFGYPLTEEFAEMNHDDGRTYTVQYFERARFEYHPEYAGTQYEVLLGLLGNWVTAGRQAEAPFVRTGPSSRPGALYFPETGHNMAPEFAGFWQRNGGLAIYGYPISEPFYELNQADGRSYLVQYFERNRFEYHPEHAGTQYEVLLGLLGSEYLRAQGWR
jgi:hypothetical protein